MTRRRWAIAAGVVLLIAVVGGALAYNHLKRPGDVSDSGAPFSSTEPQIIRHIVDWPTYGLDNQRRRFLPVKGIKPPFRRVWSFHTGGVLTEFSPVVANKRIYGADKYARAFALDANNGKVLWRKDIGSLNASSPAFHNGRVFFVNLQPGRATALNANNGHVLWHRDLPGRSESSPAVEDGKVILGCENGDVFAFDERNGKVLWERHLPGAVKGGVAIAGGVIYAGDYSGHLTAMRIEDGSIKWQVGDLGRGLGRGGAFYSTPAVAFGRVYIGNKDGRMYSYVAETGKIAWTHSTGGELYAAPAVADTIATPPSVYFGGLDGHAYALNAETGEQRWKKDSGGAVIGAGSVVGQVFYVANVSKKATAGFSTVTGKRVFGRKLGGYNPVISDGRRIYLTTYSGVIALKPQPRFREVSKKEKRRAKNKGHGEKRHHKKKHHKKKCGKHEHRKHGKCKRDHRGKRHHKGKQHHNRRR